MNFMILCFVAIFSLNSCKKKVQLGVILKQKKSVLMLCLIVLMNKWGHAGGHKDYLFNRTHPSTRSSGHSRMHDIIKKQVTQQ